MNINNSLIRLFSTVLPSEPYPSIKDFEFQNKTTNKSEEELCSFTHPSNMTCYLTGYYPTVDLFFYSNNVKLNLIDSVEWGNTDGTKGRSITVTTLVGDENYTCVASGLPETEARSRMAYVRSVSNDTAEVSLPAGGNIVTTSWVFHYE